MTPEEVRERIAAEAARLIWSGKESEFPAARKRAARHWKRSRIRKEHLPSNAEIQSQLQAIGGVFQAETDPAALRALRETALEWMTALQEFEPSCFGCVLHGPATPGAEIELRLPKARPTAVLATLHSLGIPDPQFDASESMIRFHHRGFVSLHLDEAPRIGELAVHQLEEQIQQDAPAFDSPAVEIGTADSLDEHSLDRESLEFFRILLQPLAGIRLDPDTHPEGDALYHSLQTFEHGRDANPYDEEFLLACLLHEVGRAINPRQPALAMLDVLKDHVTPRTLFLLEHRPDATHYLQSGLISRSLRKADDFDELVLLARCDRAGCVAGAKTCELDEAIEYIASLATAWDDPAA